MKPESVTDYAKRYVERCIITGKFRPGQKIKEEEISSQLGISRPPIREAFKMLETEGLVVRKPRRGVFVTEITIEDIWEIYTLKAVLYGLATSLAMDRINPKTLSSLEKILDGMGSAALASPPQIEQYQELHETFHEVILKMAGHRRLSKVVSGLHKLVKLYSYRSLANECHLKESLEYHREIFKAMRLGHTRRAETLSREHVLRGLEVLQEIMVQADAGEAAGPPSFRSSPRKGAILRRSPMGSVAAKGGS
jgi:DNA-binding GntR family transcriptional regulator